MAILDLVTKDTVNFIVKWVLNQGLAIAFMGLIFYFDVQEKLEMKQSISLLNTEIKDNLKSQRDTLYFTLKDINNTLKNFKKWKIKMSNW